MHILNALNAGAAPRGGLRGATAPPSRRVCPSPRQGI